MQVNKKMMKNRKHVQNKDRKIRGSTRVQGAPGRLSFSLNRTVYSFP